MIVMVLVACGDGASARSTDAPPGSTIDAAVDGLADATIDAPPDAPSTNPEIIAVLTDTNANEMRQDAEAHLAISGRNLDGATSVTVGPIDATIDSATATEVHVTLNVPAIVGPQAVTVVAAAGTVTRPAAIAVTPFVVSPTGHGGLGTYGSPLGLCDPDVELARLGDTIELQAGTHECARIVTLDGGVTVAGAAGATAVVRGTPDGGFGFAIFEPDAATTTIRDLTFAEPLAPEAIYALYGTLVVQHVTDSGRIASYSSHPATIDGLTFSGAGPALDISGSAQLTGSTIQCAGGDGIDVQPGGAVTLDGVTIRSCAKGLWVHGSATQPSSATITSCDFVDNGIAIQATFATATITGTTIDVDAMTSSTGVWVDTAGVTISMSQIAGQRDVGIRITSPNPNDGVHASWAVVTGVEIVGGSVGLSYENTDNNLWLRHSTIRDQTVAAFQISALDSQTDLGRAGDPGFNALSVTSGFAIDDQRFTESSWFRYIAANGTTLNGLSFDGETIEGPAQLAPYYRIADGDSGIQF